MPGGAPRAYEAETTLRYCNRHSPQVPRMFVLTWLFCFDYTFLHFPFVHDFSIIHHVPGTEKFSNTETALRPEKATLPEGQSLLWHAVAALPVCCHCKMTVPRLWFNQGYPHS